MQEGTYAFSRRTFQFILFVSNHPASSFQFLERTRTTPFTTHRVRVRVRDRVKVRVRVRLRIRVRIRVKIRVRVRGKGQSFKVRVSTTCLRQNETTTTRQP
jgi:hypothetical protein